jgi:acetyl esterase/lipase
MNRIGALIGMAGPYDLAPTDAELQSIFEPSKNGDRIKPVSFANAPSPPMLLLTGGKDKTVNVRHTEVLVQRIRRQGGQVQVLDYPNLDHPALIGVVATPLQGRAPVMNDIDAYLRAH